LSTYGALSRTALQAVGYREVIHHLQGKLDLPSSVALVKARTRQFARRQETWFRALSECTLVPMSTAASASETASRIMSLASGTIPAY
jgi:tRNA dimethylallyltransferase